MQVLRNFQLPDNPGITAVRRNLRGPLLSQKLRVRVVAPYRALSQVRLVNAHLDRVVLGLRRPAART